MNWLATAGHLVLGDLRERTRRYSFLWILLGTTFFGYLVITGQYTLVFVGYQAVYNSAWVGSLMAAFCTVMLTMVGFYLIRKTVERDRRTGVGQILASTPMKSATYILAKFVSNYLVLVACTLVLVGAAVFMQLSGNTRGTFDLLDLITPFLIITLPALGLVAGLALLFETVRWLRGTIGNVLYLLSFEAALMIGITAENPVIDFAGFHLFTTSMEATLLSVFSEASPAMQVGFIGVFEEMTDEGRLLFTWPGIAWSLDMLTPRLGYLGAGLAVTGLATLVFDRFDPARVRLRRTRKKGPMAIDTPGAPVNAPASTMAFHQATPARIDFSFYHMVVAELRLMLRGYHWSWYLIGAGLLAAQFAAPYETVRMYVMPAAWIWPLAIWSAMGTREKRFNTEQLLYSSASPLKRQFPAAWTSGLVVAVVLASGMAVRTILAGEWTQLSTLVIGALFVPTLALTLGSITGTRKFFEVFYLTIWYIGSVNRVWGLDFIGVTERSLAAGVPYLFLAITLALFPVAYFARARNIACS